MWLMVVVLSLLVGLCLSMYLLCCPWLSTSFKVLVTLIFFPIFVSRNKSKHPKLQKSKSSHQKLRKKMKLRIKLNLLVRKMNLIMMMTMKQYQMKKVIMKNINSRKRKRRKRKRNQRSRCQKAHQKKVGRMVQWQKQLKNPSLSKRLPLQSLWRLLQNLQKNHLAQLWKEVPVIPVELLAHVPSQRNQHLKNRRLKRKARRTSKRKMQARNSQAGP